MGHASAASGIFLAHAFGPYVLDLLLCDIPGGASTVVVGPQAGQSTPKRASTSEKAGSCQLAVAWSTMRPLRVGL